LKKTNRQIRKELYKYRRGTLTKEEITERVSKLWVLRNEALKRTEND
jgi:DNA-directed RNA polymerase beta' subunit